MSSDNRVGRKDRSSKKKKLKDKDASGPSNVHDKVHDSRKLTYYVAPYMVEATESVREYLGMELEGNKRLLFVTVQDVKGNPPPDRVYVATAVTKFIIGNTDFKLSVTPSGVIYLATQCRDDADKLDGQVFAAFNGYVHYKLADFIDLEFVKVKKPEQATFKMLATEV